MKFLLLLIHLILISAHSFAQNKSAQEYGISYTDFIPVFTENQDINKTSNIEIYSGVIDSEESIEQLTFIKDLITKTRKLHGKDQVILDMHLNKDKNNNLFDNQVDSVNVFFQDYQDHIRNHQVDYSSKSYDLLFSEKKRNPSGVRFANKLFWVVTKFVTVGGAAYITYTLNPHISLTPFYILQAAIIGQTSAAFAYYSDQFGRWLGSDGWENYIKKQPQLKKLKEMFNKVGSKVKKVNPRLGKFMEKVSQTSTAQKIKNYFAVEGEQLMKWGWTEYIFVQVAIEGPKLIKDIFMTSTLGVKSALGLAQESFIRSIQGSQAGMAIQMFADIGKYKNRHYDVKKMYFTVLNNKSMTENADQFLKEAKHYLDSKVTQKDSSGAIVKVKNKYIYNSKRAHPLMKKIYRRFFIRDLSISLASITGAMLVTLEAPFAIHFTVVSSTAGIIYYARMNHLVKELEKRIKEKVFEINKKDPKRKSFWVKARKRYMDSFSRICSENLTTYK